MINNQFLFTQGFWVIELLVVAAVIFWMANFWRTRPDGGVARLLRHRDRIWFALILLLVPVIGVRFLVFHFFLSHLTRGPSMMPRIANTIFEVYGGAVYGMAACWFARPARKEERFSYGMAFVVAVALMVLNSGLSWAISASRTAPATEVSMVLAAGVMLAFCVSRVFVRNPPGIQPESVAQAEPIKMEHNSAQAVIWLLVGLAPIPILLVLAASTPVNRSWAPVVVVFCALCNLCGGLGCLGRIKNLGVRIILGIFLGIFFFLLSWLVAAFEACSHSGGI